MLTVADESQEPDNRFSNLALISKDKNSALSNDSFKDKRDKIIDWFKGTRIIKTTGKGKEISVDVKDIPICTEYVSMKFYSQGDTKLDDWTAQDGEAYLADVIKTIAELTEVNNEQ